ncbi:hypothetical protein KSF_101660 [Reticulibacter mediterranei]|uniref:Uncharacterized protein n=1 Tax=Reticulibacter mediterranei TaxID=2778369 RepID=A0A8J3N8W4_9CHLR|nr:hypothetical protein KSF_101660 [Reticulibacter mediterranei]
MLHSDQDGPYPHTAIEQMSRFLLVRESQSESTDTRNRSTGKREGKQCLHIRLILHARRDQLTQSLLAAIN